MKSHVKARPPKAHLKEMGELGMVHALTHSHDKGPLHAQLEGAPTYKQQAAHLIHMMVSQKQSASKEAEVGC